MTHDALPELKQQFEGLAQELTKYNRTSSLEVQFPIGHIRKLNDLKTRWPYLPEERQRTVACIIQLCDVNQWHLNTWKLRLTAGTTWVWHCTIPVIAVIETLLYEAALQQGWIKERTPFSKVINVAHSKGVYDEAFKEKLHELREYRNSIHLFLHEEVEMHDGKPARYNDAVMSLHALEKALLEALS